MSDINFEAALQHQRLICEMRRQQRQSKELEEKHRQNAAAMRHLSENCRQNEALYNMGACSFVKMPRETALKFLRIEGERLWAALEEVQLSLTKMEKQGLEMEFLAKQGRNGGM